MALTGLTKVRARWSTFKASFVGAVTRLISDKLSDVVHVKDFGVVGDYYTNDTDAYIAALTHCDTTKQTLNHGDAKIRVTQSITFPDIKMVGNGAAKIAHFPQMQGDKAYLRPGFKHLIKGAAIFFDGTATTTYTTNRSDRYSSMTCAFLYPHFSSLDMSGIALILDTDVLDASGTITQAATDNSSDADVILLTQGTLSLLEDVTIFGYPNDAGYVVHNQTGGTAFDSDYNILSNCNISGGVAIIGHDLAAGASSEGLTGNRCIGTGIYGGDHHWRPDGDYTRPALLIDGYMGENEQSGIRGHTFTACNIRTYANDGIVTGYCNDISFINSVLEFPTLSGVAGADTQGGFSGHLGTRRFRSICAASTDDAKLGEYLASITGPFQVLGAGQYDQALFGGGGNFVRVSANSTEAKVQFNDDFTTQANGHIIAWNKSLDRLQFKHDTKVIAGWDNNGGLRDGSYGIASGSTTLVSGSLGVGSFSNYKVIGEGSVSDTLVEIDDPNAYVGKRLVLHTALSSAPITIVKTGNIRFSEASLLLDNGNDIVELEYNGAHWVVINFRDYA